MKQLLATPNSVSLRHDTWENVAYQIRVGQMPPAGTPKPAKADADAAQDLMAKALAATPKAAAPVITKKIEPATTDWLTFGYDPERTGWDRAEMWIVQSGQVTRRFESTGEVVGGEGDILYAAPMTWHQMGFKGPGLSCRLALGAYDFINMNSTAGR